MAISYCGYLRKRLPVATVFRHEIAGHQQDDVYNPPDANAANGEHFANGSARVYEVKTVNSKKAKQQGEKQGGHKVVAIVAKTKEAVPGKGPIAVALYFGYDLTITFSYKNICARAKHKIEPI